MNPSQVPRISFFRINGFGGFWHRGILDEGLVRLAQLGQRNVDGAAVRSPDQGVRRIGTDKVTYQSSTASRLGPSAGMEGAGHRKSGHQDPQGRFHRLELYLTRRRARD